MNFSKTKRTILSKGLQTWLLFLRQEIKYTNIQTAILRHRNLHSKAPLIASEGPIVSLTSYGDRLETVHLAIESIAAGDRLPSRLILWVDTREAFAQPSSAIRRLIARGLEFRLSENYGPHTKYFPYIQSTETFNIPLVIADDDILYSKWWLKGLIHAAQASPDAVNCYRAHRVTFADRRLAPYRTWKPCRTTDPSFIHFATGVSGCIYPASFLKELKAAGSEFMHVCPKADDIWLHVNALRSGLSTRQIWDSPFRFPCIPGTQGGGLFQDNYIAGQNDEQIASTYGAQELALLRSVSKGDKN